MLAHDHAAIHLVARMDHHRPTVFEVPQGEGHGLPLLHRDQHTGVTALDAALVRGVFMEDAVHDGRTARIRQQLALIPDQAARRGVEHHAGAASAGGAHVQHVGFAL